MIERIIQHVRVRRLGYHHHGVELGDGTVIHFTGEPARKRDAIVSRTSVLEFLNGGVREVVHYAERDSDDVVRSRAKSQLKAGSYNVFRNNCEHFARWCMTGKRVSDQVRGGISTASGSLGAVTTTYMGLSGVSTAGAVAGLSGPGVLSGLAAIGPGGAIGGLATLAATPALAMNVAVSVALRDDESLDPSERAARSAGRIAAKVGTVTAGGASIAAISTLGTTAGLSGAGIASGLATIGSTLGGGMVAGAGITIAAPAVAAAALGFGIYKAAQALLT